MDDERSGDPPGTTGPGTAGGSKKGHDSSVFSIDGLELQAYSHGLPGAAAQIVILHGYAEHVGRYGELVSVLNGAGFACHLMDLRGHGTSAGERGFVEDFESYLQDLDAMLAGELGKKLGAGPRFLLGHSLGGLIATHYVLHRPEAFSALALSSPFFAPAAEVPAWKSWAVAAAARFVPKLSLSGQLDARGLTRDQEKVRQYREDPLVFDVVNTRWFSEAREAQEELLAKAPQITLPVFMAIGERDPVASPARGRKIFGLFGSADKTLREYPGMLHEVFNEVGREEVFSDLVAWLQGRVAVAAKAG